MIELVTSKVIKTDSILVELIEDEMPLASLPEGKAIYIGGGLIALIIIVLLLIWIF